MGMRLAALAGLVEAADRQRGDLLVEGARMQARHFGRDTREADAGNAARHAREDVGHHRARQPHRLEQIGTTIGRNHRDTHFGNDLEEAGAHRVEVALHHLAKREFAEQPARVAIREAVLRQIGVDGCGADADEHSEIMRIETLRRAHIDRGVGAQAPADEMAVNGGRGDDYRHRGQIAADAFIGQDQVIVALAHGVFGFGANPLDRFAQRAFMRNPVAQREDAVDFVEAPLEMLFHALEHAGRNRRTFEHEDIRLILVLGEHVAEIAEARFQAHDAFFAQRIDRRIGHLAEILPEIMRQRAIAIGQHGERRVVAHRTDGFLAVFDHRVKDLLEVFDRVARRSLAPAQHILVEQAPLGSAPDDRFQFDDLLRPFFVGIFAGETVLDLAILVEAAFLKIDRDHLTGADAPLADHLGFVEHDHAGFGTDEDKSIGRHRETLRAQTVAIHAGDDPTAVRGGERRRSVPGLHDGVRIGVHGAVRLPAWSRPSSTRLPGPAASWRAGRCGPPEPGLRTRRRAPPNPIPPAG